MRLFEIFWKSLLIPNWKFSQPFSILQLVKSLPFYIPPAWKGYPFRAEPSLIVHYRERPPPPLLSSNKEMRWLWERDWFEMRKSYSFSNLKLPINKANARVKRARTRVPSSQAIFFFPHYLGRSLEQATPRGTVGITSHELLTDILQIRLISNLLETYKQGNYQNTKRIS